MRHVSMMPPTDEPPYRRRHEERKLYWMQLAYDRAHAKMAEATIRAEMESRNIMLSEPIAPFVN